MVGTDRLQQSAQYSSTGISQGDGFISIKQKTAFAYCLNTKGITNLPDLTFNREFGNVVALDRKIYAIGGINPTSVERLDLEEDKLKWIEVASTNKSRRWAASCIHEGNIFTVGGTVLGASSGERFDPQTNIWDIIPDMEQDRWDHALASAGGLLFAVGGVRSKSVECFDPREGEWMRTTPMNCVRNGLATAVINDEVYVVGGYDMDHMELLSSTAKYDPRNKTWTKMASLIVPRRSHGCCVVNNKIYVAGGRGLDTVEVYDATKNTWKIESTLHAFDGVSCTAAI